MRNRALLFVKEIRGAAALEFAMVTPLLLLLVFGETDVATYMRAALRMQTASETASQLIAQSSSGSVNYVDVTFARDSAMAIYPEILQEASSSGTTWTQKLQVTISSIVFKAQPSGCTSNCSYSANVAWSGGANPRPCGTNLSAVSDTSAPSATTLPTDVFGPGSMIVTDINYSYTPNFQLSFLPTITISRSAYLQPRYIVPTSYIKYAVVSGDTGTVTTCTGY